MTSQLESNAAMSTANHGLVELESGHPTTQTYRVQFGVPETLPLFRDHFATFAVLPAFVIIDVSLTQAQRLWSSLGTWESLPKLKLLAPIVPGERPTLELKRSGHEVSFSWSVDKDGTKRTVVTGQLRFSEPPRAVP
ncbi:MAG: hypothetical protein KUG77_29465 [Nannocystaceae bacterium]|nr:hypothetical protein [Nannocystaceae bacterium]